MLKVVHIIPSLGKGGAERIALDICYYLSKRSDVKIKLIVLSQLDEYPDYAKGLDIHVVKVDLQLSLWKKNKLNLDELNSILDEFNPDVIHTHLFMAELMGHAQMRKGVKYITHFHDNVEQLKKIPFFPSSKRELTNGYERNWIMRKYMEGNCVFIAISKNSLDFFKSNLNTRLHKNIIYLPNAVDSSTFLYHSRNQLNDPVNIINCATFVPKKNQAFLIDCLYEIRKNGINAILTFLGEGPELNNVKSKSEELGLLEFTHFKGKVNDPENYYKSADVYFHGATYEAFGLVLIEAMMSGLPVISLDGMGNRDILINGKNGFIIEEQNPVLFYERLKYLMDADKYGEMSKNALEFGLSFDIVAYVDRLVKIYRE